MQNAFFGGLRASFPVLTPSALCCLRQSVRHASSSPVPKVIALPAPTGKRFRKQTYKNGPLASPGSRPQRSLARASVSPEAVTSIFGPDVDFRTANVVLRELQRRRVTGSLVDRGLTFDDARISIPQPSVQKALTWLREQIPLDENTAAEIYAAKEDEKFRARVEKTYIAKGIRWGLLKGDKDQAKRIIAGATEEGLAPDTAKSWKARYDEAKRAAKAARKLETQQLALEARAQQALEDRASELEAIRENTEQKRKERQKTSMLDSEQLLDPNRSAFSRLWRPLLFGVSLATGCFYILNPDAVGAPSQDVFEWSLGMKICAAVALVDAVVLLAWSQSRFWWVLNRYFIISAGIPNTFSVVGAMFSHQRLNHYLANTATLLLLGAPLGDQIGWANWASIYLSSGILANISVLAYNVLSRNFIYIGLGSSGAVYGITSAYCAIEPTRTFKLPFGGGEYEVTSTQLLLSVGGLMLYPLLGARFVKSSKDMDHLNHIVGFLVGVVSGFILRREKPLANGAERSQAKAVESPQVQAVENEAVGVS